MLGMIRVRVDENAPRARIERLETFGGVSFQSSVLRLRREEGVLDGAMLRQSLRLLAMRGVSRAAAPNAPYIKEAMARYHIECLSHDALLRALAPQIMAHILRGEQGGAVLLYARRIDGDVLAAARYAAQLCRTVVLDFGAEGERVRRRLLEETGTAALLGQVACHAPRTAVLLLDRPQAGFHVRMPRPTTVALCGGAAADFNDVRVRCQLYEPLGDTDREAVLGALVAHDRALVRGVELVSLVKTCAS